MYIKVSLMIMFLYTVYIIFYVLCNFGINLQMNVSQLLLLNVYRALHPYPQEEKRCFKTKRGICMNFIGVLWFKTVTHNTLSTIDFNVLIVLIVQM